LREVANELRVTTTALFIVAPAAVIPDTPVVTVSNVTGFTADISTSAFSSASGTAVHGESRWQVAFSSDPTFASPIVDDFTVSPELVAHTVSVPNKLTNYLVRVAHYDSDADLWSAWSVAKSFLTTSGVPAGSIDPTDFTLAWNVSQGLYTLGGVDLRGGWAYTAVGGAGEDWYQGRLSMLGYSTLYPCAALYTAVVSAEEQQVSGSFINAGQEGSFSWSRYWDAELSHNGVCALASGTWTHTNKYFPQSTGAGDMTGFHAYVEWGFIWPFGDCRVNANWDVSPEGIAQNSWQPYLTLDYWDNGSVTRLARVALTTGLYSMVRNCRPTRNDPWYSVTLKVTRDDAIGAPTVYRLEAGFLDGFGVAGVTEINVTHDAGQTLCGFGGFAGNHGGKVGGGSLWEKGWTTYGNIGVQNLVVGNCQPPVCPPPCIPTGEIPPGVPGVPSSCTGDQEVHPTGLFFGDGDPVGQNGGRVLEYGASKLDAGQPIAATILLNDVAPESYAGECHFQNVYVVYSHIGVADITVTPVVDGEYVTDAMVAWTQAAAPSGEQEVVRREIDLNRPYRDAGGTERFMHGLRGASITFEITVVDLCGSYFTLDGIEVEFYAVQESKPDIIYTERLLADPARISASGLYLGDASGRVLLTAAGADDAGVAVNMTAQGAVVAPAEYGGEAWMRNLYVVVTRWNTADMTVLITPIVDNVALVPVTVLYPGVTTPKTEVTEVSLAQPHLDGGGTERFRYGARGYIFTFRYETLTGLPDHMWVIEGAYLEFDPVQESEDHTP
jgi:hypothetical protein